MRTSHNHAASSWQMSPMALFKQFGDNPSFKRWLTDTIFSFTYEQ